MTTKEWVKENFHQNKGENKEANASKGSEDKETDTKNQGNNEEGHQASNDLKDLGSANKGDHWVSNKVRNGSINNDGEYSVKLIDNPNIDEPPDLVVSPEEQIEVTIRSEEVENIDKNIVYIAKDRDLFPQQVDVLRSGVKRN